MNQRRLPRPVVERLPRYFHFLQQRVETDGDCAVSSQILADTMGVDDTLVRRDLAAIGVKGRPKIGFRATEVMRTIRKVLGFDRPKRAVLAGAGQLGGAIASYPGFWEFGLCIVAAIDVDPAGAQERIPAIPVLPVEALPEVVRRERVNIGILTVPAEAAQGMAERFVEAGVQHLWNFAPVSLTLSDGIRVRDEFLSTGLAEISYHIAEEEIDGDKRAPGQGGQGGQ